MQFDIPNDNERAISVGQGQNDYHFTIIMQNIYLLSDYILNGRYLNVDYGEYLYLTNLFTNVNPISYFYAKHVSVENVYFQQGNSTEIDTFKSPTQYGMTFEYYFNMNFTNFTFTGYSIPSLTNAIQISSTNPLSPLPGANQRCLISYLMISDNNFTSENDFTILSVTADLNNNATSQQTVVTNVNIVNNWGLDQDGDYFVLGAMNIQQYNLSNFNVVNNSELKILYF